MNVLLISPLPPPVGGIASWTKMYCEYCSRTGYAVRVVNTAVSEKRREDKRKHILDETVRSFRVFVDMAKQLKAKKIDVVHLNSSCSPYGLLRDVVCMKLAGRRTIVFHCHCNIADQIGSNRLAKRMVQYIAKRANKVFVLNRYSREYLEKLGTNNVEIVPNFIDASAISDTYCVRERMKRVVFVGHVLRAKGFFCLLEAATQLPDIEFQVVGQVYEDLNMNIVPDNVTLLGQKSKKEVFNLLSEGDAFLLPSYTEGFSIALLEAMASGLPVIATDVGANKDMIEECGGVIVPIGDSGAIVEALESIRPASIRAKMSNWNQKKVQECYLVENVMSKMLELYRGK